MHAKSKGIKTENKGQYRLPQMGEEGCGSLYPPRFLLTCYNDLKKRVLLILEKRGQKGPKILGKARE